MLPKAIENLAEKFRLFPGIGHRSSIKLALDVLQMGQEQFTEFTHELEMVRKEVKFCSECGFFCQGNLCDICASKRTKMQICLVEKPTDVISLERSEIYRGRYHVLNNLIAPLDNIFPENTAVGDLLDRKIPKILNSDKFKNLKDYNQKLVDQGKPSCEPKIELILFFKAGFPAEATTAYIKEVLASKGYTKDVIVTRLAQGLPLYYNPDTLDQATMAKALEDRLDV